MKIYADKEICLVTGSRHLYGPQGLEQVAANSQEIADGLTGSDKLSAKIVAQPTVKSPEEILAECQRANNDSNCVGLILWMHTFSPAKMWRSEEHTSELQSRGHLVCRLLLEKKKKTTQK